jgi:hypothetical protein
MIYEDISFIAGQGLAAVQYILSRSRTRSNYSFQQSKASVLDRSRLGYAHNNVLFIS